MGLHLYEVWVSDVDVDGDGLSDGAFIWHFSMGGDTGGTDVSYGQLNLRVKVNNSEPVGTLEDLEAVTRNMPANSVIELTSATPPETLDVTERNAITPEMLRYVSNEMLSLELAGEVDPVDEIKSLFHVFEDPSVILEELIA